MINNKKKIPLREKMFSNFYSDLKRRYTFTCVCYTARTMRKFEYVFNNLIKKTKKEEGGK